MRRAALGVVAAVLVVIGLLAWSSDLGAGTAGQVCVRAGIVLGVLWLAIPQLHQVAAKTSPLTAVVGLLAVGLLVARPKTLLVFAPVLLMLLALQFLGRFLGRRR